MGDDQYDDQYDDVYEEATVTTELVLPTADDEDVPAVQSDGHPIGISLTVLQGKSMRPVFLLDDQGGTVGRGEDAEVCLTDTTVSRHHAVIEPGEEHYRLRDLNSRNGTFVDDARVHDAVDLPWSCRLRFGPSTVVQFAVVDAIEGRAIDRLHQQLFRDPLTGAGNRRYLHERLREEMSFSMRHESPVCVMLVDLDRFKAVNDRYGHIVGDEVLMSVSRVLRGSVRGEDSVYRFGGEEFCILLRGTDDRGLLEMGERIRAGVEAMVVRIGGREVRITASVGCASFVPVWPELDDGADPACATIRTADENALLAMADEALYRAKADGRNCVRGSSGLR